MVEHFTEHGKDTTIHKKILFCLNCISTLSVHAENIFLKIACKQ